MYSVIDINLLFVATFIFQVTQFASQLFLCLSPHIFSKCGHCLRAPRFFILFVAAYIFQVVLTVCKSQRFLFCLSPYLFSEWHIVPQLYIQIKQSRVHSRKALYECKASRRLGKQIRGLSRFLSKAHLAAPTIYPTTLTTTHI